MSYEETARAVGDADRLLAGGLEGFPHSSVTSEVEDESGWPEGLLGLLALYIYRQAPYPNKQVAIAGAVALMAAIIGRRFNISGTGLNLYIVLLGATGIGKEAAQSGISRLVYWLTKTVPAIVDFVGPSHFASIQAFHKRLVRTPSFVAFFAEIGLKLMAWGKLNANPANAMWVAGLLDCFGKSGAGQMLYGQEYSDKDNNTAAIQSPCPTLFGDSTHEAFFAALDAALAAIGLIGRFVVFNAGAHRGEFNENPQYAVPADLEKWLADLAAFCLADGRPVNVAMDGSATAYSRQLRAAITVRINRAATDDTRKVAARAHLNVLKLAAIHAVGRFIVSDGVAALNADQVPTVTEADLLWADAIVQAGANLMIGKFESGDVGEEGGNQTKQQQLMRKVIREYLLAGPDYYGSSGCTSAMHNEYVFTNKYLSDRLIKLAAYKNDKAGGTAALKRTIEFLMNADEIRRVTPGDMLKRYGTAAAAFGCTNWQEFLHRDD